MTYNNGPRRPRIANALGSFGSSLGLLPDARTGWGNGDRDAIGFAFRSRNCNCRLVKFRIVVKLDGIVKICRDERRFIYKKATN